MMRTHQLRFARLILSLGLLCGLILFGGCSTFDREWEQAANRTVPVDSLLGRWRGTWLSDANGHYGSLRCVVTPNKDGTYRARFHAVYRKVIGYGYTVPLNVTETNRVFSFSGQADLGWWAGGIYDYAGRVEATNFFSTYRCKYDHGTFQMTRPEHDPKER
jgi:hypothetical protein